MNAFCNNCNIQIEQITVYPHLTENYFKKDINLSKVSLEIIEELPKSHLHTYYECPKCKYKVVLYEITLLEEDEVDKLKNKGYTVSEKRTVLYWSNWLKNKGKGV